MPPLTSHLNENYGDELKTKLLSAIQNIKIHKNLLNNVRNNLNGRCNNLLEIIKRETQRKDSLKVNIYKIELLRLENVVQIVNSCELALTQIILRLETMIEMIGVLHYLRSTLNAVNEIDKSLYRLISDIKSIFCEFNSIYNKTYIKLQNISPSMQLDLKTKEGEKLLEEAIQFIEKKMQEKIYSKKDVTVFGDLKRMAMLVTGETVNELELIYSQPNDRKCNDFIVEYISKNEDNIDMLKTLNLPNTLPDKIKKINPRRANGS